MALNYSSVFFLDKNKTKHTISAMYRYKKGEGKSTVWSAGLQPTDNSYFTFTLLDDGTYSIAAANVSNMPETVILPSTYNGKPVTQIAEKGFVNTIVGDSLAAKFTSVYIPASITTIGSSAFNFNIQLKEVTVAEGSNLTSIGNVAFGSCGYTLGTYEGFMIANLAGATKLTTLGDYAFESSGLIEITLPTSLTSLERDAFKGCKSLTGITIPDSVTAIGTGVFRECTVLSSVTFGENSQLTSIGEKAFYDCENLIGIALPDSVTSIGQQAFDSCGNLTSISIPGVTSIGDYAFRYCGKLAIFIPESVSTIEESAFAYAAKAIYCEAESQPEGWASIEYASWDDYTYASIVWGYKPTDDSYFTFTEQEDGTYSVVAKDSTNMPNEVYIPLTYNGRGVTALGYKAFNNCYNITKIVLPESIKTIGSTAFQNCEALTEVNIPSGVTEIGDYTFFNCKALTTVTIPSGVTSIGELAFANCSAMTSIVIPASVTTIGMQAFFNSRNLTINCEATEQPEGWVNGWNSSGLTVNWGYTG
jgi:hypothetical protein